jgi:hypothetical protein
MHGRGPLPFAPACRAGANPAGWPTSGSTAAVCGRPTGDKAGSLGDPDHSRRRSSGENARAARRVCSLVRPSGPCLATKCGMNSGVVVVCPGLVAGDFHASKEMSHEARVHGARSSFRIRIGACRLRQRIELDDGERRERGNGEGRLFWQRWHGRQRRDGHRWRFRQRWFARQRRLDRERRKHRLGRCNRSGRDGLGRNCRRRERRQCRLRRADG